MIIAKIGNKILVMPKSAYDISVNMYDKDKAREWFKSKEEDEPSDQAGYSGMDRRKRKHNENAWAAARFYREEKMKKGIKHQTFSGRETSHSMGRSRSEPRNLTSQSVETYTDNEGNTIRITTYEETFPNASEGITKRNPTK